MIAKILVTGAILASLAVPALAATKYFVVQDVTTHKCSVVDKKPDGKTAIKIGSSSYATEAAAQAAMAAAAECKAP